jgi:hypothetical protein
LSFSSSRAGGIEAAGIEPRSVPEAAARTSAVAAKAAGADALDDPVISDSYSYCRDPGVFSGHAIMVTQAFPP